MPKGFSGVRRASKQIEARRNQGGFGPQALYFGVPNDGDEATVRFLEQGEDISWCWVHKVPVEGQRWPRDVVCLDQDDEDEPCPGCERKIDRKFKGFINLIWFDAPVFKRDSDNKIVKVDGERVVDRLEDQIAVWSSGVRLFDDLSEVDESFKGLRSRRFKVKRKGTGLSTKYKITPEDIDSGKQPFSPAELELEAKKHDLAEFTKAPSYDDFMAIINGDSRGSSKPRDNSVTDAKSKNPFMRAKS